MSLTSSDSIIGVDWPAAPGVCAVMTTRLGGVSQGVYQSFNLAGHVGDLPANISANRLRLNGILDLDPGPCWMNQVHGNRVVKASPRGLPEADGIYTMEVTQPLGVLVADCLPILMCDRDGTCVAAIHAGWRGLANGVIKSAVDSLPVKGQLMAWLGPAIGPCHYEVGREVRGAFSGVDECFVRSSRPEHWMMNLSAVATRQLAGLGVTDVYGGNMCTFCDATNFYSYRRDGQGGRQAAVIWLSR